MLNSIKIIVILFIIFTGVSSLYAQSKVEIKYTRPPLGKLGVGDMWNLTLNNTTGSDIKIYLAGSVTEEKDGLIIEGKTKVFTLKPGKTSYKYNDFSSAEIKYNNGKYKESLIRQGNAPEGDYTICITAFDEGGAEVGREDCMTQNVRQTESITLLTPGDGEEVDMSQPVMFSWTPLPKGGIYKLRIVELKGGQSPETALIQNSPIFEKDNIRTASYQGDPVHGVDVKPGMKLAWQVSYGDAQSDPGSYMVISNTPIEDEGPQPSEYSITCTGGHLYIEVDDMCFEVVGGCNGEWSWTSALVVNPNGFDTTNSVIDKTILSSIKNTLSTLSPKDIKYSFYVENKVYRSFIKRTKAKNIGNVYIEINSISSWLRSIMEKTKLLKNDKDVDPAQLVVGYPPNGYPCLGCAPCPGNPSEFCDIVWNITGKGLTDVDLSDFQRKLGYTIKNGVLVAPIAISHPGVK